MELTPRFFFYGHAAAIGGRMFRPRPFDIEVEGASALTPAGGVSRAEIAGKSFGNVISFGRASTLAVGRFQDEQQALAMTHHRVRQDELRTETTVSAEIERLQVGQKPQLLVRLARAALTASSPNVSREPSIQLSKETELRGVSIDGYGLTIRINHELFGAADTFAKLQSASDDRRFLERHAASLLPASAAATSSARTRARDLLAEARLAFRKDVLYTTIVRSVEWTGGRRHPGGRIDGHIVTIKNFGMIFLGEMLISSRSRRLTMMRLELGSPDGGMMAISAVDKNGGWAP
jgi:hypothetical protein